MSLEYIQRHYNVPAKIGERVVVFSGQHGTIVEAHCASLKIIIDGEIIAKIFHPTWKIAYFSNCPWLKGDKTNQQINTD